MRMATSKDIPVLVDLMDEFYAEGNYRLDRGRAEAAFTAIVSNDRLGWVWLIENTGQAVGHLVLTVCFAMEYGGPVGFVDDLFVKQGFRGRGLATQALTEVREFCRSRGIRGLAVEVAVGNAPAQKAYRRVGLAETGRQLLRLGVADPIHVVS